MGLSHKQWNKPMHAMHGNGGGAGRGGKRRSEGRNRARRAAYGMIPLLLLNMLTGPVWIEAAKNGYMLGQSSTYARRWLTPTRLI